jgi:hypothetical protein
VEYEKCIAEGKHEEAISKKAKSTAKRNAPKKKEKD